MSGLESGKTAEEAGAVGAKMVSRAQNELEHVIPGTVFLSYHGEGLPWGREMSDSNTYVGPVDTWFDDFQLACVEMILRLHGSAGSVIPRLPGPPTCSSTSLSPDEFQEQCIDTPAFEIAVPTFNSGWGGVFPRERALELENELFMRAFTSTNRYDKRYDKRYLSHQKKAMQEYYDDFRPKGMDGVDVDREWLKFVAAQERWVRRDREYDIRGGRGGKGGSEGREGNEGSQENGKSQESEGRERSQEREESQESNGKEGSQKSQESQESQGSETHTTKRRKLSQSGLYTNKFYSADDVESDAKTHSGTPWSEEEKDHFFDLLGRVGRHRLDEIAECLPCKSLAEVEEYHDLLFTASEHQKEVFNQRVAQGEEFIPEKDTPISYRDIPAALEMSDKWIALEESFAHSLADKSNEKPLPKGEAPFESIQIGDEDEHHRDLLNNENLLSLASELFYPNPANGMDIESLEYNTDLPVFKGIEGDAMKELLLLTVEKTRQLFRNLLNTVYVVAMNNRKYTLEGNMQMAYGIRYSSLSRFFRSYIERSGSELVEEEEGGQVRFVGANLDKNALPKLYRNTGMLCASLKNMSKLDKSRFLGIEDKKRLESLMKEEMQYSEEIKEGDIGWMEFEGDDLEEEEEQEDKCSVGGQNPDYLYPYSEEDVPTLLTFMHDEETSELERLDQTNAKIEEQGLAKMFAYAAPYRYSRVFSQANSVLYDLDKKEEREFKEKKKRYLFDAEGKQVFGIERAAEGTDGGVERTFGGGLIQREQLSSVTSEQDLSSLPHKSKFKDGAQNKFMFNRPFWFMGRSSDFVYSHQGRLAEQVYSESTCKSPFLDMFGQFYRRFGHLPRGNPYTLYENEKDPEYESEEEVEVEEEEEEESEEEEEEESEEEEIPNETKEERRKRLRKKRKEKERMWEKKRREREKMMEKAKKREESKMLKEEQKEKRRLEKEKEKQRQERSRKRKFDRFLDNEPPEELHEEMGIFRVKLPGEYVPGNEQSLSVAQREAVRLRKPITEEEYRESLRLSHRTADLEAGMNNGKPRRGGCAVQ